MEPFRHGGADTQNQFDLEQQFVLFVVLDSISKDDTPKGGDHRLPLFGWHGIA